ncbi:MAG: DUF1152 domain-containing protein [Bacillota bacterium]
MKESLQELAIKSRCALLLGVGGGGDIIQTIPVGNFLRLLGVKRVYYAGVSCQWWPFDAATDHTYIMAPTVYDLDDLSPKELVSRTFARVGPESTVSGKRPAEAAISEVLGHPTYVLGLQEGVAGMAEGLSEAVKTLGVDLVVAMDVGSDSFYSHTFEIKQPRTPLVDFMSLCAVHCLDIPRVYGLSGYACDGEQEISDLDRNVSRVMAKGGFLGGLGLTPKDVADMDRACRAFPDPVEKWPAEAAKGNLGLVNMKLMEAWGTTVKLTPLTAVTLFFDLDILLSVVATPALRLMGTRSLREAEDVRLSMGILPETRLPSFVNFLPGV